MLTSKELESAAYAALITTLVITLTAFGLSLLFFDTVMMQPSYFFGIESGTAAGLVGGLLHEKIINRLRS